MSIHPAELAMRDQAAAACRDARSLADPGLPEAFTTWLQRAVHAHGPATVCPHFYDSPRALDLMWCTRSWLFLGCCPCRRVLLELAGPSDAWLCDRCQRRMRRPWRTPTRVSAAIGPVLARVELCAYCAFDLGLDTASNPRPTGHPQEGSPS
jgi:hypothetical protein